MKLASNVFSPPATVSCHLCTVLCVYYTSASVNGDAPSFDQPDSQRDIFDELGEMILDHTFDGFNCTVAAYGASGTGKTFTLFGPNSQSQQQSGASGRADPSDPLLTDEESQGLAARLILALLAHCKAADERLRSELVKAARHRGPGRSSSASEKGSGSDQKGADTDNPESSFVRYTLGVSLVQLDGEDLRDMLDADYISNPLKPSGVFVREVRERPAPPAPIVDEPDTKHDAVQSSPFDAGTVVLDGARVIAVESIEDLRRILLTGMCAWHCGWFKPRLLLRFILIIRF